MEHAGGNWLCHVLPSLPDRVKKSLLTLWSVTKFPDRVKESLHADPVVSDEVYQDIEA